MKKKYYACNHSGLAIRNIAEVNCNATGNQVTATDYNYSSGKIKTLSNEGCECFLYDNTEISKSEFENLKKEYSKTGNNYKDLRYYPPENTCICLIFVCKIDIFFHPFAFQA